MQYIKNIKKQLGHFFVFYIIFVTLMFLSNETFIIISFLSIFGLLYSKIKHTFYLEAKETSQLILDELSLLHKLKYYANYNIIKTNIKFYKSIKRFFKNIFIITKKIYKKFIKNYLNYKNKIFLESIGILEFNFTINLILNHFENLNIKYIKIAQRNLDSSLKTICVKNFKK